MKSSKVFAIALDAAEPSLIEKWMDEGYLKNLALLRSKGAYGRLASSADWLVGSTWPTFYTSSMPDKHGFYHYIQWVSSEMDYERPAPNWISAEPFWRRLSSGTRVIAVDIPLAFPPDSFNGIEISGWAAHDRIYPISSYPPGKIDWVINKMGKPLISDEVGGLQEMKDLLKLKDELINANEREAELISLLLRNEEWDLFMCCLASTHRAGHKLWTQEYDEHKINIQNKYPNTRGSYTPEEERQFSSALKEVYRSCDEVIGSLLNVIPDDASIVVFSLHGMGVNTTLADKILPGMLSRILSDEKKELKSKKGFLGTIRNLIPLEIRSNIRSFLPARLQDKMTAYWRMGNVNWGQTKAFSLVADLQGYIRINLMGRERDGIVSPEEFEPLCDRIISGICTFHDEATGESIVQDIKKTNCIYSNTTGCSNLPDILVKWKFKPAAAYRKIVSPEFGELEWPLPGKNPDGRSGNHRPEGFFIASGNGIKSTVFHKKHIIDIAPTILSLLNEPIPGSFEGKAIKEITHSVEEYRTSDL